MFNYINVLANPYETATAVTVTKTGRIHSFSNRIISF